MNNVKEVENYLASNLENIDSIVEQVVEFLPDSYFYLPEIRTGELKKFRQEINDLQQKSRFHAYKNDDSIIRASKKVYRKLEKKLDKLANKKRSELLEELLGESIEMKIACSLSLIMKFNMLKRMRKFY